MVEPRDWEWPCVTGVRARSFYTMFTRTGDIGLILIPPAASEERVWVWAGKTRKLRVAGVQAWGT